MGNLKAEFETILNYLKYLEKTHSLYISVHILSGSLRSFMYLLGRHNTHRHPFCMSIKKNEEHWRQCLNMQEKVLNHSNGGIFCGSCRFGHCEWVVPIKDQENNAIGFISVSENNSSSVLSPLPPRELIENSLSHIAAMFSLLDKKYKTEPMVIKPEKYIYQNALAYIHKNFRKNIKAYDIARFCHCSTSSLTHLFKATSKKGLREYINALRISESQKLLKNTEKSIKEIAFEVGYNDSNYFSNLFFKHIGKYPREYRKLYGANKAI